jgi:hypothetical protein
LTWRRRWGSAGLLADLVRETKILVVQDPGDHQHLEDRAAGEPYGALRQRHLREQHPHRRGHRIVGLGAHPDRRALVDGELGQSVRDGRDQLDCGGAGADDPSALAVEVVVVVPLGGVDDLPAKGVDPLDVRHLRLRQEAGRGEQVRRGDGLAVAHGHDPVRRLLVPAGTLDHLAETHVPLQVVLVGDMRGVLLQLRPGREQPGPVRFGSKE